MRVDLENRIQSLKEELSFLGEVHKQVAVDCSYHDYCYYYYYAVSNMPCVGRLNDEIAGICVDPVLTL